MNKEIILLSSPTNTGKTTSIVKLYEDVIKKHKISPISYTVDVRVSFKINGKIIGFCSNGDNDWHVKKNIDFFKKHNCEICITACRTKGVTKNKIIDWGIKNSFSISFVDYISCIDINHANEQKVNMMKDRLSFFGI